MGYSLHKQFRWVNARKTVHWQWSYVFFALSHRFHGNANVHMMQIWTTPFRERERKRDSHILSILIWASNTNSTKKYKHQIKTRTTRTPAFWGYPPPPHDYPYHWVILDPKSKDDKVKVTNFKNSPKFQIFEFWNGHYTRHTRSCLIRCANIKWIRWVLLKTQRGHDSVHRRTDGQGDTSIPPYQLCWSGGYNNTLKQSHDQNDCHIINMDI